MVEAIPLSPHVVRRESVVFAEISRRRFRPRNPVTVHVGVSQDQHARWDVGRIPEPQTVRLVKPDVSVREDFFAVVGPHQPKIGGSVAEKDAAHRITVGGVHLISQAAGEPGIA